ncbi:MAG: DNA-processing protein DprA [Hoylesella marshii]|uniref:DNA-processing protein DprA n=1 Tax=Hoylesella marshii TaxID=189722 RepID=UPI003FA005B3
MNEQETIYAIALTLVDTFNPIIVQELYERLGSATAVMEHRKNIRDILPDCSQRLAERLANIDKYLRRAEEEWQYAVQHHIVPLCMNDEHYPQRLRECADAPSVLFYRGKADLNPLRVISIVGTRQCTRYGQDLVRRFISDLRSLCPQTLVISGLAYGIDIHAHRQALSCGLDTVAVLAHGHDNLYPSVHKDTAAAMLQQGGLITEYPTHTRPDKMNFVKRNRIVAGMSDACILVESSAKGGGLITARIAFDYNRDVFAFPGRTDDIHSEGCNYLIRDNVANLISNAEDFVRAMQWDDDKRLKDAQRKGIERQLFPDLSPEEQQVVTVLQTTNDLPINMLTIQSGIAVSKLTAILFTLEMKGVVRMMAGSTCHLLK